MIKKILCFLGFHKWKAQSSNGQLWHDLWRTCKCCNKTHLDD